MALAQLLQPRICELGKIKIGGLGEKRKSQSGGEYRMPVKHDHFRVTTLQRNKDGDLIEDAALMSSLADYADGDGKLRQLPISLLSNDVEEVLQAAYIWYNGKKLAAKSDGTTLTIHFDREKKEWLKAPKSMPWEPRFAEAAGPDGKPLFKLHCTLNVVVASPMARFGGLYKFRTTSRITSDQLYGSLVHLKQLTGGILRGLPLRLVVRPVIVSPEGKTTTVYVVHVELPGSDIAAIQAKALELARFEVTAAKELAAARTEYKRLVCAADQFADDEEEEEVAQEFHPHQQPGTPGHYPEALPAATQPTPQATAPEDNPADDQEPDEDDDADTTPEDTPIHTPAEEPKPAPAPAGSPDDLSKHKIGGQLVTQILTLMNDVDVDWPSVRGNKLDTNFKLSESGGIAAAVGFTPSLGLKVAELTAAQGLKLHELLKKRATEKAERAAKRNGQKAGVS